MIEKNYVTKLQLSSWIQRLLVAWIRGTILVPISFGHKQCKPIKKKKKGKRKRAMCKWIKKHSVNMYIQWWWW